MAPKTTRKAPARKTAPKKSSSKILTWRHFGEVLLAVWIIFSAIYIAVDLWQNVWNANLMAAYQQGQTATVDTLITEAQKCEPIRVFSQTQEVYLQPMGCGEEQSANQ